MARKYVKKVKPEPQPPPETPGLIEALLETQEKVAQAAAKPAASGEVMDDGAALGYCYPPEAVGKVVTVRDYGDYRLYKDSTGRRLRQDRE